jgi:thiamine-phosphate pyrophosphorylase
VAAHARTPLTRRKRAQLLHGIYVILNEEASMLELAAGVLAAGVRLVQYRAKAGIVAEQVRALRALTRRCGALLIMNDDWPAADEYDCDGVHLGPGDAGFEHVAAVRAAVPARLIGVSCGTLDEILAVDSAAVDYVGVGSIFATHSKDDAGVPIGMRSLRALARASPLPVAAVGGITVATIPEIRRSGAAMAAVISAVAAAAEPQRAARALVEAWNR